MFFFLNSKSYIFMSFVCCNDRTMLEAPLMPEGNIVFNTMLSVDWLMTEIGTFQIEMALCHQCLDG